MRAEPVWEPSLLSCQGHYSKDVVLKLENSTDWPQALERYPLMRLGTGFSESFPMAFTQGTAPVLLLRAQLPTYFTLLPPPPPCLPCPPFCSCWVHLEA